MFDCLTSYINVPMTTEAVEDCSPSRANFGSLISSKFQRRTSPDGRSISIPNPGQNQQLGAYLKRRLAIMPK